MMSFCKKFEFDCAGLADLHDANGTFCHLPGEMVRQGCRAFGCLKCKPIEGSCEKRHAGVDPRSSAVPPQSAAIHAATTFSGAISSLLLANPSV
jgi:hypothetical protein